MLTNHEPMNRVLDPIALLEQGYVHRRSSTAWLHEMAAKVTQHVDADELGGVAYFLTPEGPLDATWVPRARSVSGQDIFAGSLRDGIASVVDRDFARLLEAVRTPGLMTLKEVLGGVPRSWPTDHLQVHDSPAIVVHSGECSPAIFATFSLRELSIDRPLRSLWRRIAAHLGAGLRLCGRPPSPEADDVECVLMPGGRVVHARGSAEGKQERERLRAAAKDVDRARTRRGRSDPNAALELWRGLFSGRWSLVDHFDGDGRRYLLARRNDPDVAGPPGLSLRQRQILFFASAGWSNKEIGYALGIREGTVAAHLLRALDKLGLPSRVGWVRMSAEILALAQQNGAT